MRIRTTRWAGLWLLFATMSVWASTQPQSGTFEEGMAAYDEAVASQEPFHPGFKQALAILEPLSEQGNLPARYHVGILYYLGAGGITIDQVQGITFIKEAADAGYPTAQAFMGLLAENGDGMFVRRGEPYALGWYLRAADGGQCAAMKRIIAAYEKGELGLSQNPEEAEPFRERLEDCTRR